MNVVQRTCEVNRQFYDISRNRGRALANQNETARITSIFSPYVAAR
jgi:hypothetical protein